jgi:hypothetical protein
LDRWIEEDEPSLPLIATVIRWLMDLRRNPQPPEAAPVPGAEINLWLADIPGTNTVSFLYEIRHSDPSNRELVGWLLQTL